MTPSDAQLVTQALHGSQDAYRELVERHGRAVFNLVARMVREGGVAEELAQDAFLKAFSALRSFDPSYKFSNWILRIAHNTAIDYLRRTRPEVMSFDAEAPGHGLAGALIDDRDRSPLDRAVQGGLREDLEAALGQLRPEYRRLVIMRYLEDLSYEDIADALGMPLGTVKSHLHRARAALAVVMTEAGWGPKADPPPGGLQPGKGSGS